MGLVVGIPRTGHNTSHYAVRKKNANSRRILNVYTAYMYAHSEICSLTKPIIHSFQYIHYGLRRDTHDQFCHDMPEPISSTRTFMALPGP
jgi:hypothetical protein